MILGLPELSGAYRLLLVLLLSFQTNNVYISSLQCKETRNHKGLCLNLKWKKQLNIKSSFTFLVIETNEGEHAHSNEYTDDYLFMSLSVTGIYFHYLINKVNPTYTSIWPMTLTKSRDIIINKSIRVYIKG